MAAAHIVPQGTQLRRHGLVASHISLLMAGTPLLFVTGCMLQSSPQALQRCLAAGCSTAVECGALPAAAGSRDILVTLVRVWLFARPAAIPFQPGGSCGSQSTAL